MKRKIKKRINEGCEVTGSVEEKGNHLKFKIKMNGKDCPDLSKINPEMLENFN
ncbi:MAG: hypothetical protein AABY22_17900 [Nanoarchaeota archaeon]